jgi:hypothetical protein
MPCKSKKLKLYDAAIKLNHKTVINFIKKSRRSFIPGIMRRKSFIMLNIRSLLASQRKKPKINLTITNYKILVQLTKLFLVNC